MKCRYNNHHHNNDCAYRDDVIKLAIEHEDWSISVNITPPILKTKNFF